MVSKDLMNLRPGTFTFTLKQAISHRTSDMDTTSRAAPVAEVACASCRRLKMKCVGSANPPCARCAKAGRECIVQRPSRAQTSRSSTLGSQVRANESPSYWRPDERISRTQSSTHGVNDSNAHPGRLDVRPTHGFSAVNSVPATNQSVLPSIYTTPPYSTVFNQPDASPGHGSQDFDPQKAWKRQRTGLADQSPRSLGTPADPSISHDPISERDMIQYIDIFRKRLLSFIPVIAPADLDDAQLISTKKQLGHCICYVTARYIPGGEVTRAKLAPAVSAILREKNFLPKSDEEEWTMLQALSVLYAYRPSGNGISIGESSFEISQWTIKGYIETYALYLSVHRSISGLKASIRAGEPNLTATIGFKKYTCWLWLFNMSHYYSVITGTPPSIREDATIRMAPEIFKGIDIPSPILQILAEAELCLLWGKAGLEERGLSEWWCPPGLTQPNLDHVEQGILGTVDSLLQAWSDKWTAFFPSEPLGPDIDFHFRFTRFCLSTYSVQNLKLVGASGLSRFQQDALNKSVAAAANFCRFTLELGPAIRDAARYMADFGFVMMSFACLFIIQACENFYSRIDGVAEYISDVEGVAQMLKEFAINLNHGPNFQARTITAKLQRMNEVVAGGGAGEIMNGIEDEMHQQFRPVVGEEDFMNDPLWHLLDFFPEIHAA